MPEPKSSRDVAVTKAPITDPWETILYPLGSGGLDLASAVDKVKMGSFTRLTNAIYTPGDSRELTGRPGQTALATAAGEHHSIARVNDPQNATYTRIFGVDDKVYQGQSGALGLVDSGYSGDPLTLLPFHPTLSGEPWTFIGDSVRMRKIRIDGLSTPIGLPAPTVAATTGLDTQQTTIIESFASDVWTPNNGAVIFPVGTPISPVTPGVNASTGPSQFQVTPPVYGAPSVGPFPYYQYWGLAKTLNLNLVGAVPATDDDIMQLSLAFPSLPDSVAEVRLYLVCSETFSPGILPGTVTTVNQDFYVKSFTPSDLNAFVSGVQTAVDASLQQSVRLAAGGTIQQQSTEVGFTAIEEGATLRATTDFTATTNPTRPLAAPTLGSVQAFTNFGTSGVPLSRGDFQRFGTTAGRDWGTITGLVIYLQANKVFHIGGPTVEIHNWQLTGGSGPNTMDAATQSYDYRYTHYDPRTGAEGNPSPEMDQANFQDSLRRTILIQPTAYGDAAVRQRFYRRGGTLTNDWYFEGENAGDGATFTDALGDLEISASDLLAIDHYQPVPTVDANGDTVLAQPVPVLLGPVNGQLFALGDPYRPGFVYASLPGEPDHWPPDLAFEVCPPSEELMNGVLYGGQITLFSRTQGYNLYVNLTGTASMTATPSGCKRGLAGRWAVTVGYGAIWFVANDGIYRTTGGAETLISQDLQPIFQGPLFQGRIINGYRPVDMTAESALRLACLNQELYFGYQDDQGNRQVMVYQILTQQWRHYEFGRAQSALYSEGDGPSTQLLIGGLTTGKTYTHDGTSDDGLAIAGKCRTGSYDYGRGREEKIFGDQFLSVNRNGVNIQLINFLNEETVVDPAVLLTEGVGRVAAIFDTFGTKPQRGRTLASELSWVTDAPPPILYYLGTSVIPQPELTLNRMTNWDDLGTSDEKYVMGITLDVDTGGEDRHVFIEGDILGVVFTIAQIIVNANGRHKLAFSWPARQARMVRLRPLDDCLAWILYRADWLTHPEPPRVAVWDIHFENAWDSYYTGLDIECDTFGAEKRIEVWVDETRLNDPATGLPYWAIVATGRRVAHLTLPWGRGHVFRFVAIDANDGLLYQHRWHLQEEPSEQTNWNQNFNILGTRADKWLKALIFECDTFGLDKTVEVQADGVTVTTLTVNTTGRKVVQRAIPQVLGRVWRFFPTDANPGRLYSAQPVFDEEPFQLDRWETQELDYDLAGFFSAIDAMVTVKSSFDVTLTLTTQLNQETGVTVDDVYVIPATGGVKRKKYVSFVARKGVLVKHVFTSAAPFWLYQEESSIRVQPWGGDVPIERHLWGNADTDRTRAMVNAVVAAGRSGGGTS